MRHSKSRFIESRSEDPDISGDARRVGTGAVRNRTYQGRKCLFIFAHLKTECNYGESVKGGASTIFRIPAKIDLKKGKLNCPTPYSERCCCLQPPCNFPDYTRSTEGCSLERFEPRDRMSSVFTLIRLMDLAFDPCHFLNW